MDPVTLILTALTAGAGAIGAGVVEAAKDSTKDAITSMYAQLKVAIFGKARAADPLDGGAGKTLERHASNPTGYEVPDGIC